MTITKPHDRLRVLMLVSGLDIGGAHGGAERFGLELTRHLDKKTCEVTLCAFWKRDTQAETYWHDLLCNEGVEVIYAADWPGRFDIKLYTSGVKKLKAHTSDQRIDIIHSHYQMGTLAAIWLKLSGGTRIALRTAHVSQEWGFGLPSWICRQIFTNWLYPMLLDMEVGVSQAIVNSLKRHPGSILTTKRPSLIHNAIYTQAFAEDNQKEYTHPLFESVKDKFIIGSIGRLTSQKGYKYLLKAIPEVLSQVPNVFFVIIGDGILRENLIAQTRRLGIQDKVLFTGQRNDVIELLRKMHLFVLPSLYEGLPTVVLESMACGIPVLATGIPGTKELICNGWNGWLVNPKEPSSLAQAIILALENPIQRDQIIRRARDTVASYRIEAIADQYEKLYRDLFNDNITTPA